MTTDPRSTHATDPIPEVTLSRRSLGKRLLLGASALAVLLAAGKHEEAQAAPITDDWHLGGNTGVSTDGTNFIGTRNVAPLIFKTAATTNVPTERMRISEAGSVGIGLTTPSPSIKLQVYSPTYAIYARHTAASGTQPGVYGETLATAANASGVQGVVRPTAPGANSAGVLGQSNSTSGNGSGVRGTHAGAGYGVHGTSVNGYGVRGEGGYNGVYGRGNSYGVIGSSTNGYGVYGSGGNTAVYASGGTYGAQAYGATYGVYGSASSYAVFGQGGSYGVLGDGTAAGVYGSTASGNGVQGYSSNPNTAGVYGSGGQYGVQGYYGRTAGVRGDSGYVGVWGEGADWGFFSIATRTTGQNYGIMAESKSPQGFAGYFKGRVHIEGILSKGGGSFKIDHPLDPENKYLSHSFVESPDMMNVYNGNVTTNAQGDATVELPAYFEALNRDFRYQLTVIGQFAQAIVATKIATNRFTIKTDKPDVEVSWQVTGIRQDAFANANRIPGEEDKPSNDRGRFLHPQALGKAANLSVSVGNGPQAQESVIPEVKRPEPPKRDAPPSGPKPSQ